MAKTLDESELEAGERLLANATPAGWEVGDQPHSDTGWLIFGPDGDGLVTCHGNTGYGYTGGPPGGDPETDARAVVWLRNHAPALIALARAGLAARQAAHIDPALLDRLEARYAADPEPGACRKCGTPLVREDYDDPQYLNIARRWDCPRRCGGGVRYQESGDADVLALVRAARRAVPDGR